MEKLFTVNEVAEFLGVSRTSVYNWIEEGKLRSTTDDKGSTRISAEVLRELVIAGMEGPLLKLPEVARRLDLRTATIRQWVKVGKLKAVRVPDGRLRVRERDFWEVAKRVRRKRRPKDESLQANKKGVE